MKLKRMRGQRTAAAAVVVCSDYFMTEDVRSRLAYGLTRVLVIALGNEI